MDSILRWAIHTDVTGPTILLVVQKYVWNTLILLLVAAFAPISFACDPNPLRAVSTSAADNQPTPSWTWQGVAILTFPPAASQHLADHKNDCCCHQHDSCWWLTSRMHRQWLLPECWSSIQEQYSALGCSSWSSTETSNVYWWGQCCDLSQYWQQERFLQTTWHHPPPHQHSHRQLAVLLHPHHPRLTDLLPAGDDLQKVRPNGCHWVFNLLRRSRSHASKEVIGT